MASPMKGLLAAVAYGTTSVAIVFVNKAIFQAYDFKYSNVLTAGQMLFSLVGLSLAKQLRVIEYPNFSPIIGRRVFPLALSFILMVVTGLAALSLVNVPMYSALRRLATLVVMVMQYYLIGKTVTRDEALSVGVMVLGAIIGGFGDLTFDMLGYVLVALNCLVTASYLVYISKVSKETQLSTFGLMFYNNLLSFPIVLLICLLFEYEGIVTLLSADFTFQMLFFCSAVQAFLLNYFIYLCSTMNSPLTTSITGQVKALVTTIYGLFAFGDVEITQLLVVGLAISSLGGIWYGFEKYAQSERAKQKSDIAKV